MTLDLRDPAFVADPYPALAELRKAGPMVWHAPSRRWLATTHDAVSQVLRDRSFGRIWSDWEPAAAMAPFNDLHKNQMMESEGHAHARLRNRVSGAFGRGHVERMRPRIESLVDDMLDRLSGTVDILAEYAEPLPVHVICDLLGVPRADHVQLRAWSQSIVRMYEQDVDTGRGTGPWASSSVATKEEAVAASVAFADYVGDVVAERRRRPGDDLVTDLLDTDLSEKELVASVVLLLNAGHEASVNAFGNGIHALLTHRGQLEQITSGAVPMATALEELLRFDAPLQLFERTATADVEVAGTTVPKGQVVACLMGSANRDEAVFGGAGPRGAASLDVGRDPNPHVGFGMGVHFCLGAPLARLELEITFRRLLERWPRLEPAAPAPRRPTWVLRGFERIEVSL